MRVMYFLKTLCFYKAHHMMFYCHMKQKET
jgi:hypothetical protein